jgi:hypothetical protein
MNICSLLWQVFPLIYFNFFSFSDNPQNTYISKKCQRWRSLAYLLKLTAALPGLMQTNYLTADA